MYTIESVRSLLPETGHIS